MTTNSNNKINSTQGISRAVSSWDFRLIGLALTALLVALCAFNSALGQQTAKDDSEKTPMVTASVVSDGLRIAAPSAVVQLRLEVYDEAGQKLFDNEHQGGDVLDWNLQGAAGERVIDGTYLCVVTIKNPSGQLNQELGLVTVAAQSITVRPARVADLSPVQAQVLKLIEGEDKGLAVVPAETAPPVTVVTHTGDEAQLTRTRGDLSFRVGDFFTRKDTEQMRLTEDGRLGIGTDKPGATLDVAGTIRARGGIVFEDGSVLTSSRGVTKVATGSTQMATPNETIGTSFAGIGTTNKIAKWTDAAGTLGDSVLSESNGYIGVGVAAPVSQFHVNSDTISTSRGLTLDQHDNNRGAALLNYRKSRGTSAAPLAVASGDYNSLNVYQNYDGSNYLWNAGFGARVNGVTSAGVIPTDMFFYTSPTHDNDPFANNHVRMLIGSNGNVGIGTTAPAAKLDVAGDVKMSSNLTVDTSSLVVDAASDRVGIGTATPTAGLEVKSAWNTRSALLIDNGNNAGGDVDSAALWIKNRGFGGLVFRADDTANDTTPFLIDHSGNVGVGTTSPTAKLDVVGNMNVNGNLKTAGTVESTAGGFKFPDGSVQTSAASPASAVGKTYTTFPFATDIEIGQPGGPSVPILQLDLPAGSYMVTATVQFENRGLFNKRFVSCTLINETVWFFRIEGSGGAMDTIPITMHTVITQGGTVKLSRAAIDGGGRSNIFARARRFTAVRLGDLVTQ